MDLAEATIDRARAGVLDWLSANLPAAWIAAIKAGDDPALERARAELDLQGFLDRLAEGGYAVPTWPREAFGLGATPEEARVVHEELERARAPRPYNPAGLATAGPTLIAWGTEEQKKRLLWPIVTGREVWCQLHSEPGHGSDLAGLATRAERAGDEWIVNGQKVWTSWAHEARRGLLLARTDPDAPKHQGLTVFAADMHAPGVTVRPLKTMAGDTFFNEVWFTDARIPDTDRIGSANQGWTVTTTTLMNERVALGGGQAGGMPSTLGRGPVDHLIAAARGPAALDRVMRLWVESAVNRLTSARIALRQRADRLGPEGSIGKLASSEHSRRLTELGMSLSPSGMAWEPGDAGAEQRARTFLSSQAITIGGGTSNIQRNIIGERVLGLPKDIDVSRDVPWKDVPRSAPKIT
jgi:alkylation response protein AidB-like acyl-CoA dehydrogenase